MKKELKINIQQFAEQTYNPANVLLSDAVNGQVPTEYATLILEEFLQNASVMSLAKAEPMTTLRKQFSYLAQGPGAFWVDETERIQTDKAEWVQATMEAKKMGVIIPVSKEFLRYSVADFFNAIRPAIAEAFAVKFDQAALFGNNSPYGAGNSVIEAATAAGNVIASGTNENIYLDLNAVIATIEDADLEPNGFTTTRKFKQKVRGAVDTNNLPIFNETTAGAPNTLLGLPVGYVSGKSWDYTKAEVLAGDWDYARYGVLQDLEYAISTDATLTTIQDQDGNPVNLFERDMFALRVTQHVAFAILNQDAFAALTPATP